MTILNNEFCQTPISVWNEILKKCPINDDEIFFEPFKGEGNLFNLIQTNKKYYTEITEGLNVFDFDFKCNDDITIIYTNPPFKVELTNKKGEKKLKNCVYHFLEYFILNFVSLTKIGFLMNTSCFQSLTPKRLKKLDDLGFSIQKIIVMNIQKWFGRYYFVVFEKNQTNKMVDYLENYF